MNLLQKLSLLTVFLLTGCKCGEVRTRDYSYCIVTDVQSRPNRNGARWVATCDDGSVVTFSRVVKIGDGVYYTPFIEDNDRAIHGYIKDLDKIL